MTSLVGKLTRFDLSELTLSFEHPLGDAAGNLRSEFVETLKFLPVGAPKSAYDFESPVASWNATFGRSVKLLCDCRKISGR